MSLGQNDNYLILEFNKLKDEVERLKADVRNCHTAIRVKDDEYARLKDKSSCQAECLEAFEKKLHEAEESLKKMHYNRIHDLNKIGGEQEENARLKAEVDALMTNPTSRLLRAKQAESAVLAIENDSLKAEVERLRKAGDDMASSIQFNEEMEKDYDGPTIVHPSVERWNAAKEGKV